MLSISETNLAFEKIIVYTLMSEVASYQIRLLWLICNMYANNLMYVPFNGWIYWRRSLIYCYFLHWAEFVSWTAELTRPNSHISCLIPFGFNLYITYITTFSWTGEVNRHVVSPGGQICDQCDNFCGSLICLWQCFHIYSIFHFLGIPWKDCVTDYNLVWNIYLNQCLVEVTRATKRKGWTHITYHYNLEQFSSFLGCLIFAPG